MNCQSLVKVDNRTTLRDVLLTAGAEEEYAAPFRNVILPYTPRGDQIEAFRKQVTMQRFGLFSEARTGKSISFVMSCIYFAHWGLKSVILMPPVLFLQFKGLWEGIENNPASLHILSESKLKREQLIKAWQEDPAKAPDVLVMTSAIFKKDLGPLLKIGYGNLVYDEAHTALGSEESATYVAVKAFSSATNRHRVTLSTGTPIPNEIFGAYPIISLVNPVAYSGRGHFNRTHVNFQLKVFGHRTIRVVESYKNLDALTQNLYMNAHRVTKKDVLNLDAPNIQIIPVELDAAHRRLYRTLMTQRVLEHGNKLINAIQAQALRQQALQLITTPQDYGNVTTNVVLDTVEEILDSVGAASLEKVVCFANYNRSVETLVARLKKYNPAVVYGPGKNNGEEAERFKTDQACRVLVANPIAGGVGLTLGAVSSTVVFVEPVSTPGQFDQAVSRVMLAGQTKPVSVYVFDVKNTISPRSIQLMLRKGGEQQEVMRDGASLLREILGE